MGETIEEARSNAYKAVARIHWTGEHHRTDIGLAH
jgi:phosphoribosylamine-glycine ligase